MRKRPLVAVALLAITATGAIAQDPQNGADAKPAKEKKSCRVDEATGSIMPQRTCHTQSEWAAIDRQNQANTDAYVASKNAARGH